MKTDRRQEWDEIDKLQTDRQVLAELRLEQAQKRLKVAFNGTDIEVGLSDSIDWYVVTGVEKLFRGGIDTSFEIWTSRFNTLKSYGFSIKSIEITKRKRLEIHVTDNLPMMLQAADIDVKILESYS